MSRFILQPEDIELVSRAPRSTELPEEILQIGRERVAAGESVEDVALDLAIYETSLLGDGEEE